MKRMGMWLLAGLLALVMAGCSDGSESSGEKTTSLHLNTPNVSEVDDFDEDTVSLKVLLTIGEKDGSSGTHTLTAYNKSDNDTQMESTTKVTVVHGFPTPVTFTYSEEEAEKNNDLAEITSMAIDGRVVPESELHAGENLWYPDEISIATGAFTTESDGEYTTVLIPYTASKVSGTHDLGMYQIEGTVTFEGGGASSSVWEKIVVYGEEQVFSMSESEIPVSATVRVVPKDQIID